MALVAIQAKSPDFASAAGVRSSAHVKSKLKASTASRSDTASRRWRTITADVREQVGEQLAGESREALPVEQSVDGVGRHPALAEGRGGTEDVSLGGTLSDYHALGLVRPRAPHPPFAHASPVRWATTSNLGRRPGVAAGSPDAGTTPGPSSSCRPLVSMGRSHPCPAPAHRGTAEFARRRDGFGAGRGDGHGRCARPQAARRSHRRPGPRQFPRCAASSPPGMCSADGTPGSWGPLRAPASPSASSTPSPSGCRSQSGHQSRQRLAVHGRVGTACAVLGICFWGAATPFARIPLAGGAGPPHPHERSKRLPMPSGHSAAQSSFGRFHM